MQIFRNCADITLVGDGGTTTPPTPAPAPPPVPVVESVPEEIPPPEFIEEGDPPMGQAPLRGPPMGMGPMAAPPIGRPSMSALPPMMDAVLFDLAVVDVGNNFETLFVDIHAITIVVADYPNGFGIRALVEDSSQVQTVDFTTSEGYTHTEYNEPYNMFTRSVNWTWLDPPFGAQLHYSFLENMYTLEIVPITLMVQNGLYRNG